MDSSIIREKLESGIIRDEKLLPSDVWAAEGQTTRFEKEVERTLYWRWLVAAVIFVFSAILLFFVGIIVRQQITFVDPVEPDYSGLVFDSENYWQERTKIDIQTAQASSRDLQKVQRLQRYLRRTVNNAVSQSSDYNRIMSLADIALTLARNDIDYTIGEPMDKIGNSRLAGSMRCRILVSQALMYIRLKKIPSAKVALQEYDRLMIDFNLRLDSPVDELAFSGAVTANILLQGMQELPALFKRELEFTLLMTQDRQSRAYRFIAGEQIRAGMTNDALETIQRIQNPVEMARAFQLFIAFSARPAIVRAEEPKILELPVEINDQPLAYPERAKMVMKEVVRWLIATKTESTQLDLLQRIAGSRLMCDREIYRLFFETIKSNELLSATVKADILNMLANPVSPQIRAALNMPPQKNQWSDDTAKDDWSHSDEIVPVEIVDVDSGQLANHFDERVIQTFINTAQSYLMVNRQADAVRVSRRALTPVQAFPIPETRVRFLLDIAVQQIGAGAAAEAKKTMSLIDLKEPIPSHLLVELARLQIIGRFLDDVQTTLTAIQESAGKDNVHQFLALEQIQINRLDDAEKTISKIRKDTLADEVRHHWNIAKGKGQAADYAALNIPNPETAAGNDELSRCANRLIQLVLLGQAAIITERIQDKAMRAVLRRRIVREYVLLYNAYAFVSPFHQSVRRDVEKEAAEIAKRADETEKGQLFTILIRGLTAQLQNEQDRETGKQYWSQALTACRNLTAAEIKADCLAELILAKIALEKPLGKTSLPMITKESHPAAFEEINNLVGECTKAIEAIGVPAKEGLPCVLLAKGLAQIGRTNGAHSLLEQTEEIANGYQDADAKIELLLQIVPVYRLLEEMNTVPDLYRLAVRTAADTYTANAGTVNLLEWRQRDSSVDRILRNELENGVVDLAIQSVNQINEPMLRDRILRAAAYIYLDQNNLSDAETIARRMSVKNLQRETLQSILLVKRRAERKKTLEPKIKLELQDEKGDTR